MAIAITTVWSPHCLVSASLAEGCALFVPESSHRETLFSLPLWGLRLEKIKEANAWGTQNFGYTAIFFCAAAVLSLNNMLPSVQCALCLVSATCQQLSMTNKIRSIFITVLLAPCAIFSSLFYCYSTSTQDSKSVGDLHFLLSHYSADVKRIL